MSRTFTIHNVTKIDGCPTKKPRHSRYFNEDPMSAAKKAHTVLCNRKRIHGSCTLIMTMRETTSGSAKKLFTYKVTRSKLSEPVELDNGVVFKYETTAHKAKPRKTTKKCSKSAGPMRRRRSHKRSRKTSRKRSRKRSR